ncbi:MAG: beta-ketoacyl-[acyl-carrier-protein] synthase family protein [Rhodobiaceae bacterium]|nr:beta-ketoacyl-[acyl-carrier-protein] synthase family protein [Rhodobiaceae bacterium]
MTEIAITGMGAVAATGIGTDALWAACRDGIDAIGPLELKRPCKLRVNRAAQVRDFDPLAYLDKSLLSRCDRFSQFAHVAAAEAIAQSGLEPEEVAGPRTAVIVGTGVGGFNALDDGHYLHYVEDRRVDPMGIPRQMPSSAASHISMIHGTTGPCFAVSSACASASQSIGTGALLIRAGLADRAIVGGAEAATTPVAMRAWETMRVLTPDFCRPFSMGRSGMVIGEGAGLFVIERADAAKARGARPLAMLSGYGTTSDARDVLQPDMDGAAAAMTLALADAGLGPDAIDYVNAHGTGTVLNDRNEAGALRMVFGNLIDAIPVSSSKPIFGHGLGAGGALELVVAVNALREGIVPPQINFLEADPACPLYLPTDGPIATPLRAVLSNSFAFGGINASLVVTHPDA